MEPRIELIQEKTLVGKRLLMSFLDNKTRELWKSFMPHKDTIENRPTLDLISLQVYPPYFFETFDPNAIFEKWALAEVEPGSTVPKGMDSFKLEGGLYAVFEHHGSNQDVGIFNYIFRKWLPASVYALDNRPHFELLGENYRNNDPDSEEEIWIPIRVKG